ncbi:MAG TPA: DUF4215 domain-containing protein [Nannocystaceae bacterium]|nr:DUF4215 domain-containing protein [Nannocystaceae bacterium]
MSKTTPVPLLALLALSACHIGLGEDTEWGTQGATSTSTTGTGTTTDTATTSTTSGSSNGTTTTTSTTSDTATTDDSTTTDTTSGPDPVCGNGMKEGGEECDDGNKVNDDMCTNMCSTPKCGDMLVQTGEECDDGNKINEDACLDTCKKASCGDGFIQSGPEECDKADMTFPPGCIADSCMWDKRIVFVTSTTFKPGADSATAFNSIATADAKCQAAAKDKFPGTFRAWLSGGANNPATDWTGLNNFAGKFVLPNSTIVATGWNNGALSLDGPIDIDENKQAVDNASVWTGTNETGTATTSNCNVWLQGNGNGTTGLTSKSDPGWTNASEQPCGDSRHLYCFQTTL